MLALSVLLLGAAAFAQAKRYDVTVGGPALPDALTFQPPYIDGAKRGDVIVFTFKQKNHTLTESKFPWGKACDIKKWGYDTGFIPVDPNRTDNFPTVKFKVHNSKPMYFNCAQVGHCTRGMVFAINPGKTWDKFLKSATTPDPVNHKIVVGGTGESAVAVVPNNIKANVGDTITFEFHQKNHTMTQSAYTIGGAPCSPLKDGFNSGFMPVADDATTFPTYKIKVKDTKPIYAFCMQGAHCSKAGQVFAANAPDFEAYRSKAVEVPSVNHKVIVGGTGESAVAVAPNNIKANVGDTITFEFHQKNHSMTQSAYSIGGAPCSPLEGGFNSGFMPVADDAATFPTYTITVKDTKPIYAFCMQGAHCSKAGQVFAANAPDFDAYKAKAIAPAPVDHKVVVGGLGESAVAVVPNNIKANIGDTITFEFHQKNHSMTQSAYTTGGSPCTPLEGGFNSGFMPVADDALTFPTYTVTVKDDKPIYAFCMQGAHCSKAGQVFAANAPDFEDYRNKATTPAPTP